MYHTSLNLKGKRVEICKVVFGFFRKKLCIFGGSVLVWEFGYVRPHENIHTKSIKGWKMQNERKGVQKNEKRKFMYGNK